MNDDLRIYKKGKTPMKYFWSACFTFLILSGCSENTNNNPKDFFLVQGSRIPSEKALKIMVYRKPRWRGYLTKIPIFCNGNRIAKVPSRKCLALTLEPGHYSFHTGEGTPVIKIVGKARQEYFVEIYMLSSWWKTRFELRQIEKQKGVEESGEYSKIELTYRQKQQTPRIENKSSPSKGRVSPFIQAEKGLEPQKPGFFSRHPLMRYFGILFVVSLILLYVAIRIFVWLQGPFTDMVEMVTLSIVFILAVLAVGSIFPFYIHQWIPQQIFLYYFLFSLIVGIGISFMIFLLPDEEWGFFFGGIFFFFLLSFYAGFVPLKLLLKGFPEGAEWFLTLPWWKAMGMVFFGFFLVGLNIFMVKNLEGLQDYSGGDETATTGFWAKLDGKFYMHATKRETGEWTPPIDSFIKLLFLNGILIGITIYFYFSSTLTFQWGILIYTGLLILSNVLLLIFGWFRS